MTGEQSGWGFGACFGNGDGTFQAPVFYPAGSDIVIATLAVGDFNGDGISDVVTEGESGIWLFTGKGGGVFNPGVLIPETGLSDAQVRAADFNGDGKLDLAVDYYINHVVGLMVLFGNGDGTFEAPVKYPVVVNNQQARGMSVGDLNLDGHPDIVLGVNIPPYAYVYLYNGSGGFTLSGNVDMNDAAITIGDVNGDQIPDLVNEIGVVAFGLGNGQFQPPISYPVSTSGIIPYSAPALADLRNNGRTDIVSGLTGDISVLINEGNGKFEDGVWTPASGGGNCGAAADFNGDGIPDLAVPTNNGIVILLGTGKKAKPYTTGMTLPLSGPGCPITGDVTGDGIPDLLERAGSLGGVGVYLGKGDGTFHLWPAGLGRAGQHWWRHATVQPDEVTDALPS